MDFTGKYVSIVKDWGTDEWQITFTVNEQAALRAVDAIKECEKLSISATKYHKRRSLDANALMWVMITQLAAIENVDKWKVYLDCLRSYGKCAPVTINACALDAFKQNWREVEEVGRYEQDGIEKVSLLCYFGSSMMTTDEFSRLLDGIKYEMISVGLMPPASEEMRRCIEEWEKSHIPQSATSNQS